MADLESRSSLCAGKAADALQALKTDADHVRQSCEGDALSVRLEFQVDCLARVWANRADKAWNVLKTGDVDEVMNAASAIGDDTLQRQSHGTVVPEPFMHGTSEQRQRLFRQGLNSGNPDACNTFGVDRI
jgi:predicted metalloprotease